MAHTFVSQQGTELLHGTGQPHGDTLAVMVSPILCRFDGTRYGKRIPEGCWQEHHHRLKQLYDRRFTREQIHQIIGQECLLHDCNFHPTLPQLNRKMKQWGLSRHFRDEGSQSSPLASEESAESPWHLQIDPATHAMPVIDEGFVLPEPDVNITHEEMRLNFFDSDSDNDGDENGITETSLLLSERELDRDSVSNPFEKHGTASNVEKPNADASPAHHVSYCAEICCRKLIKCHKHIVAASFLAGLNCWSQASAILRSLICEIDDDASIAVSDQTWAKLIYNRINGSIFKPDRQTSIWSTNGWCSMAEPLRAYIQGAHSEILPSALAHICLTSQYRTNGTFDHYPSNVVGLDSHAKQVQILQTELEQLEGQSRVIIGLLLWCVDALKHASFRSEIERLSIFMNQEEGIRQIVLPRLMACHFMSLWVETPDQQLLQNMIRLRLKAGVFLPDVMLPELFIAFSHMILKKTKHLPVQSNAAFVDNLLNAVKHGAEIICRMAPGHYCSDIAIELISICDNSSATAQQVCHFSEHLALSVAYKMLGVNPGSTNDGPFAWMRVAHCFQVNTLQIQYGNANEDFIEPAMLTPRKKRSTTSSNTAESTPEPASISSRSDPRSKSSCSTISSPQGTSQRSSFEQDNDVTMVEMVTPLKAIIDSLPRRFPTTSSGQMSLDEMKDIAARVNIDRALRKQGIIEIPSRTSSRPSRTPSGSSGMSWGTTKLFGLEKTHNDPSKIRFSYMSEEMTTADATSDCASQINSQRLGNRQDGPQDVERHHNVSQWIRRQYRPAILARSSSAT